MFPRRYTNLDAARALFGDRVDRLGPYLTRVDEVADRCLDAIEHMPAGLGARMFDDAARRGIASTPDAPESFRELFDQTERVPLWVDWDVLDRGGALLLRAGPLGGLVLALKSLVSGYRSPAGNKPLAFSGRLTEQAPRRLRETGRFIQTTIQKGGLRPHADGYSLTLKVRLIHAGVRRMILRSGRWNAEAWGAPVNQHDQMGTSLLFSAVLLEGLEQLGVRIPREDADAYMHLWRYSGYLMGIDPELLPSTQAEGDRLTQLLEATHGEPDEDSRRLTRALLDAPLREAKTRGQRKSARRLAQFSAGMCRELVGDDVADKLAVPRSSWRLMFPLVRGVVSSVELIRESVPYAGLPAAWAGSMYWDRATAAA
jgi:hypothetical protein